LLKLFKELFLLKTFLVISERASCRCVMMTSDNETVERPRRKDSRTYLSMLAHAAPIRNAWRLWGFLVMCLVIGCQCPTTPPIAAEGPQSLARALDMGAAGAVA
jgi:hypothetical protein